MTLLAEQCRKGMKVYLVNPDSSYNIGRANPLKDSRFECPGIITSVCNETIYVDWANLTRNSYNDNELSLIEDTAMYRSIW